MEVTRRLRHFAKAELRFGAHEGDVLRRPALWGAEEGEEATWLSRNEPDEIKIAFDVEDSGKPVACVELMLGQEEARLVGRMAQSDLDEPVAKALKDVLLSEPGALASVKAMVRSGTELGFEGGKLLGAAPRDLSSAEFLYRIMDGEEVQRLPDDREERCPLSREKIRSEYILGSRRQPWQRTTVAYVQSIALGEEEAWLFLVTAGREQLHALVRYAKGRPRIEWWG